jgi:hypothetical protein
MSIIHLEKPTPRHTRKLGAPKAPCKRGPRRGRSFHVAAAAGAVMLVALALLGLSLSHLASGVAIVRGSGERDGWLATSASIWASSRWRLPMSHRISPDEGKR